MPYIWFGGGLVDCMSSFFIYKRIFFFNRNYKGGNILKLAVHSHSLQTEGTRVSMHSRKATPEDYPLCFPKHFTLSLFKTFITVGCINPYILITQKKEKKHSSRTKHERAKGCLWAGRWILLPLATQLHQRIC